MEHLPEFIGNHLLLVTLTIAVFVLLVWNLVKDNLAGVKQLSPAESTRLINREHATVLDISSSQDFAGGHIIDARNIPHTELANHAKDLAKLKQKPVIICCPTGTTAVRVARDLRNRGFEQVYILKGGLQAWQGANLPLSKGQ